MSYAASSKSMIAHHVNVARRIAAVGVSYARGEHVNGPAIAIALTRLVLCIAVLQMVAVSTYAQTTTVVEYYHTDSVGSVRAVTDQSGTVIRRHDDDPFGQEFPTSPSGTDALRFTSKERDDLTGLHYFGARYYAAQTGRFTTVDPARDWRVTILQPQRWNRYAYAGNNPLRYIDPDGREIRCMCGGVSEKVRDLQKQYDAASGLTKLWVGIRLAIEEASLLPTPFVLEAVGERAVVVLGETMTRVNAVAEVVRANTFREAFTTLSETMARNIKWLETQIGSGAKIYDIGYNVESETRGVFYAAEVKTLENAGYTRRFVKVVMGSDSNLYELYEWIPKKK